MEAACRGQHVPVGQALATISGNLANGTGIKHVIHAVAPRWDRSKVAAMNSLMRGAVDNSLAQAASVGATSVDFPALGTGVFGWSARAGVECIVKSVMLWLKQHPNTSVQEVYFTDVDQSKVDAFQTALKDISSAARSTAPAFVTTNTAMYAPPLFQHGAINHGLRCVLHPTLRCWVQNKRPESGI